jgi:hypothetical protein
MYYFILEPPKTNSDKLFLEKTREISRQFGIASEISQSSPARSAGELTQIALMKNYSTIIAVGAENHINRVVREIMKAGANNTCALGIICTQASSMLSEKWGFRRPEDAVETLKQRRLSRFDIGFIEPDIFFLTSAKIEPKSPVKFNMKVDQWDAEGIITRAEISSNLYILLERLVKERSIIKSALNLFGGPGAKEGSRYEHSIFKGKSVKIETIPKTSVYIGTEIVAKTPVSVYRKLSGLNIIVKRDRILSES